MALHISRLFPAAGCGKLEGAALLAASENNYAQMSRSSVLGEEAEGGEGTGRDDVDKK